MWQIRRIYLDRIGTTAARFIDVTIDLTDEQRGAPLDTILWLRNGGGKSTVMALLGALLRPARGDFLSASEHDRDRGRHLEDYVLGSDTAHVAVEWSESNGRRLVTGAVYEWNERTMPADPTRDHDRLNQGWYLFAPVAGRFELDRLPFMTANKQTGIDAFLSQIRPFATATDAVVSRKQSDWLRALDDRGIDAELWRTVLEMNKSEGGIQHQFLFSSADDFVRYLLRLIVDPSEPEGVAELLRKVTAALARRPDTLAELWFASEAIERLSELDTAWRDDADARGLAAIAEGQAQNLRLGLRAGQSVALEERDLAGAIRDDVQRARREHDSAAEVARHTAFEYLRLAAVSREEQASARITAAVAAKTASETALDAWTIANNVAALDAATARAARLDADLRAATADAEPLRVRFEQAAAILGALLDRHASEADAAATIADATASREREAAEKARTDELTAAAARARAEARAAELTRLHAALDDEISRARADAMLAEAETPIEAQQRLVVEDEAAAADRAHAVEEIGQVEAHTTAATARAKELGQEAAEMKTTVAGARRAREELGELVAGVAAEARLADLLGADEIEPVGMAPTLVSALRAAMSRLDREITDLGVQGAEDLRAIAALDSEEGLLPPVLDLVRALDMLAAEKIAAIPGWHYLARLAPERRTAAFLAAPELAGGVLVADEADLTHARELLGDSDLGPTSIVALGSTAELERVAEAGEGASRFVVPPNRALYDRERARDERGRRGEAEQLRAQQRDDIGQRRNADGDLIARITHLVSVCPPGTIEALDGQIESLDARLVAIRADEASTAQRIAALAAARKRAVERREAATEKQRRLARSIDRVSELARRWTAAEATRDEAATLPGVIKTETAAEASAGETFVAARDAAAVAVSQRAEQQEAARGFRRRRGVLPDGLPVVDPGKAMLASATADADAAKATWDAQTTGSPLARLVEEAEADRVRLTAELETKDEPTIALARSYLSTSEGADAAGRDRGLRAQRAAFQAAAGELAAAESEHREAKVEVDRYSREDRERHRQIEQEPESREQALALAEDQRLIQERMNRLVTEDDAKLDATKKRHDELDGRAKNLDDLAQLITLPELEDPEPTEPWGGSIDAARSRVHTLLGDIEQAADEARRTHAVLEDERAKILAWSGDTAFTRVPAEVVSRFRSERVVEELGPEAAAFREDFALRRTDLEAALAALDEHRANVVTRAMGMVTEALGDIDRFSRLSALPEGLGAWGGKRFIEVHIRPTIDRSEPVMRDRIGREIDRIIESKSEARGMDLLWRAVFAVAGEGGFTARILKPSPAQSLDRVPIEAMHKWSGGEKVTTSLLLFVTVAKLRARNRGKAATGAGALVLDNPLGTANYVNFLDLQRAVARAAGVQLVFLTAVADMKAVGRFPRVARLRNVANRGRDYVTVAGYDRGAEELPGELTVTHGQRLADPLPLGLD